MIINQSMSADEIAAPVSPWDWLSALFLFSATALVVVWQNSRLGVLWDLSYVLENSFRMSLGQVPYRDFPFPYPPLTFLIQAALIKLAGRAFWHHVVYCAVMGGGATVLTWRILINLFRETPHAPLLAFSLSLPLVVLGIYCVFPHPFYDPDCTFAILLSILLLQHFADGEGSLLGGVLAGMTLVIPLFIKQNTGSAFLATTCLALFGLAGIGAMRHRPISHYAAILAGAAIGLLLALLIIQITAGLENYLHWTVQYAASRRMPPLADTLAIYEDPNLPIWIGFFVLGTLLLLWGREDTWALLSALLFAVPFAWPAIYLLIDPDPSERADRLLALWPALLIVSFVVAVLSLRQRAGLSMLLPFILIGTINGALMSQQLWGSTYAIWPLFIVLFACSINSVTLLSKRPSVWMTAPTATLASTFLLIAGGTYVWSHERLDYAKLDDGQLTEATLPELKGLSTRGNWIPNFEQLARYAEHEIPEEDAILILPGEDLFYYTTGRQPRVPVLMFDHTVNPYTPDEVLKIGRDLQVRWLVVKHELQLDDDVVDGDKVRLTKLLKQDFKMVKRLKGYDVYQRRHA
ncbi:MAG: hypothetical protein WA884_14590 [Methyloceanibacter sp.]